MKTHRTIAELIEVIPDAALILNRNNELVMVNTMLTEMFGYAQRRELLGQPLDILLPEQVRAGHAKHVAAFFNSAQNRPMGRGFKFVGERKDGSTIYVEIMLSHVDFDGEHFAIAFVRDATSLKVTEDKIRRELEHERILAQTDHLTGVANRRAFVAALDDEIHDLRDHGLEFAVCFIDLDDFKKINDTHGHEMGDQVLQQIAHVIESTCRANDLVARIGGDEFATIHVGATLQDAMTALERIRERLVHEFAEHDWPVTLSMGICHCNDPQQHFEVATILRAADKAMYEAKKQGKNQIKIAHVAAV
ncbi:sensor domain-containing diguanylate cyclase [Pseudidiomarina tainanensis]|jgi:diguanylate cyclase (GGDEF)-like protein/PAS domain S-box-containing protein|uniref:diguanylate cyclase n=2 Tax=Pseudidiomarina TaxID=2800384 RepID=A0A1I6G5V9_9GAMM|nr:MULTISPECIES: sensor domain-containing diguanylate cyclase [Pseudidiomarina]RZQ57111.1 sensor domain-containing diguanylate cyclase [Pseudidiomarina tainanensis]SFR37593.1 PAS domain S-box-containing protein/diguanylate cyclase (GGDEF) domain-containing protein [Pseudidiomarina maritima]